MKNLKLQAVCGSKGADDQVRLTQSLTEAIYQAAIRVTRRVRERSLVKQENQPGRTHRGGLLKLQLSKGYLFTWN